uniref:Hda101 n=1 Tax=Arundo donax TaxID=35708 RepID=A0A0A9F2Z2_ARUDO
MRMRCGFIGCPCP